MRTVLQDLRYGVRLLRGNPGFALTAVLTLALAIGANTTVFSWIDGVLLQPLPGVTGGDRIAVLETIAPNGEFMPGSYADYDDYGQNLKTVSGIAMSWPIALSIGEGETGQRTWGELVSGNYFGVLGVKPALGRVFLPEEYAIKPGGLPLAVISHHLWQTRFRGDPGILGRTVRVNRHAETPSAHLCYSVHCCLDLRSPIKEKSCESRRFYGVTCGSFARPGHRETKTPGHRHGRTRHRQLSRRAALQTLDARERQRAQGIQTEAQ